MTFGGSGENPTTITSRQHSEPPFHGPERPPGDGRFIWEKVVKWAGITLFALFLVLFVYLAINGSEDYSENRLSGEQIATLEARRG